MTILRTLKRTTAIAALAALPLAPVAVQAESAQVTGTQPPAADQQADQAQQGQSQTPALKAQQGGQQTGLENVEEQQLPGMDEAKAGAGDPWVQDQEQAGQPQAAGDERGPANEAGIVTEGKEGTQSGEAPDQAPTDDQTGLSETAGQGQQAQPEAAGDERGPANEAGIVTEGKEGTQSGEAPDQAPTDDQSGSGETTGQGQADEQGTAGQQGAATGQQGTAAGKQGQQATSGADEDALVATVGDREIRQSDVLTVIGLLPPQLQQQPPEMLIPIALDQLVMRELILQEAKQAGIESDPAVSSLDAAAPARAKEDAMVQVWLDKELGKAVTDEHVQQSYDTVKQQLGDQAPSMEELRPEIEQELRQQAFVDISKDLQADAEITLYGPDGQPLTK